MRKYSAYLIIVAVLGYAKCHSYLKALTNEFYFDMYLYMFLIFPLLGLVFGFLLNLFDKEFLLKRKINLINLSISAFFLFMYYYPFIPNSSQFLGGILMIGMSPIYYHVIPILSGFYLSKGLFIRKMIRGDVKSKEVEF